MPYKKRKQLNSQAGFSLIEVVASLVILTIILLSFFGLLIQSKKTEKQSEEIIDATYIAQAEMEKIYSYSRSVAYNTLEHTFTTAGYTQITDPNELVFTKGIDSFLVKIRFKDKASSNKLKSTIIEVMEGSILKSKMENIYNWEVK